MNAVQGQIASIRDFIQRRQSTPTTGRPLGFAAEPAQSAGSSDESPWQALAYNGTRDPKSPILKAPPMPPAAPAIQYASWGQLFGDHETRTGIFGGIDIGRRTLTGGGIGGADATIRNITSATDVLVLGVLGGAMTSHVRNNNGTTANVQGPSLGAYGVYVNRGFSTDLTFKSDFLGLDTSTAGFTGLGLNNYTLASNASYKVEGNPWWYEPTAGTSFTRSIWDGAGHAVGFTDGRTMRVQGGVRFGTTWDWNGVQVDPVLTTVLYSDVIIHGGTLAAVLTPAAPTDEGKVFGQVIGKLNFNWGRGLTSYVEGEARGRDHVVGVAGRVGVRYAWN